MIHIKWLVFFGGTYQAMITQQNMQERGFLIYSRCLLCENELENTRHIFIRRPVAGQQWDLFFIVMGVMWDIPSSVKQLLGGWKLTGLEEENAKVI